jgi:hypothetical protein
MFLDHREWLVQEHVRIYREVLSETITDQNNIFLNELFPQRSGVKKFSNIQAALFQSFGCIFFIVEGGTAASTDIMLVIILESKEYLGTSPNGSINTGLPMRSMSPAVGSRNVSSIASSPSPDGTALRSLITIGETAPLILGGSTLSCSSAKFNPPRSRFVPQVAPSQGSPLVSRDRGPRYSGPTR